MTWIGGASRAAVLPPGPIGYHALVSICLYIVGQPPAEIRARHGDFVDMFARIGGLARRGFDVVDGPVDPAPKPAQFSGLIISGSAASVLDSEAWMDDAVDLIGSFASAGRPVLGVCFGHQLIAKAFGGSVRRADVGLMSSTWSIELTAAGERDPLFRDLPPAIETNFSHRDEIVPSDELTVLANGPHSIAAIGVGDCVRGVQFHPEFSAAEARAYVDYRSGELGDASAELAAKASDTPGAISAVENFLTEFVDRA